MCDSRQVSNIARWMRKLREIQKESGSGCLIAEQQMRSLAKTFALARRINSSDARTGHRILIEAWRGEYNIERPHSSLGDATPADFAKHWLAAEDQIKSNQPADSGSGPY